MASFEMSCQRASNCSKIESIGLSLGLVATADTRSNALDSSARVCAGEIDVGSAHLLKSNRCLVSQNSV